MHVCRFSSDLANAIRLQNVNFIFIRTPYNASLQLISVNKMNSNYYASLGLRNNELGRLAVAAMFSNLLVNVQVYFTDVIKYRVR